MGSTAGSRARGSSCQELVTRKSEADPGCLVKPVAEGLKGIGAKELAGLDRGGGRGRLGSRIVNDSRNGGNVGGAFFHALILHKQRITSENFFFFIVSFSHQSVKILQLIMGGFFCAPYAQPHATLARS